MNISKVYYEELKSKCVNGKWGSVRIGAEVDNEVNTPEHCLSIAKNFVQKSLKEELGYDDKEKDKAKKLIEQITKEVEEILAIL